MNVYSIVALLIQLTVSSEYLKCVHTKMNELESKRQIESISQEMSIKQVHPAFVQRILAEDSKLKTEFSSHTIKETGQVDEFVHSYFFKIQQYSVIELLSRQNIAPQSDSFWVKNICKPALLDLSFVSDKVAKYFCARTCNEQTLGKMIDYKFARFSDLIKVFKEAFKDMKNTYSSKIDFKFYINIISNIPHDNGEISQKIKDQLDALVEKVNVQLSGDVMIFQKNVSEILKRDIYDFANPLMIRLSNNKLDASAKTVPNNFLGIAFRGSVDIKFEDWHNAINDERVLNAKNDNLAVYQDFVNYIVRKSGLSKKPIYLKNIKDLITINCFRTLYRINPEQLLPSASSLKHCSKAVSKLFKNLSQHMDLEALESNQELIERIKDLFKLRLFENFGGSNPSHRFSDLTVENFVKIVVEKIDLDLKPLLETFNKNLSILKKLLTAIGIKVTNYVLLVNYYTYFCQNDFDQRRFVQSFGALLKQMRSPYENVDKLHYFKLSLYKIVPLNNVCGESRKAGITNSYAFLNKLKNSLLERYPDKIDLINSVLSKVLTDDYSLVGTSSVFSELIVNRVSKKMDKIDLNKTNPSIVQNKILHDLSYEIKVVSQSIDDLTTKYLQINNSDEAVLFTQKLIAASLLQKYVTSGDDRSENGDVDASGSEKIDEFMSNVFETGAANPDYEEILTNDNLSSFLTSVKKDIKPEVKAQSDDSLSLVEKLEVRSEFELPPTLKADVRFMLQHVLKLPKEVRHALEECNAVNPNKRTSQEACMTRFNDSSKCVNSSTGLVIEKCDGEYDELTHTCYMPCPRGFDQSTSGYCKKPDAYQLKKSESSCPVNYRRFENWCMPVCPLGWMDSGASCKIPVHKNTEIFYVVDLHD